MVNPPLVCCWICECFPDMSQNMWQQWLLPWFLLEYVALLNQSPSLFCSGTCSDDEFFVWYELKYVTNGDSFPDMFRNIWRMLPWLVLEYMAAMNTPLFCTGICGNGEASPNVDRNMWHWYPPPLFFFICTWICDISKSLFDIFRKTWHWWILPR